MSKSDEVWLFVAEWFDPLPRLKKQYVLKYFVDQHMVEMFDVKNKKVFLKKSACPPELTQVDFFIGGRIILYGRDLEIIDYGDPKTRERLKYQFQQILLILPSELYQNWGKMIDSIQSQSFTLSSLKSVLISSNISDNICQILGESSRRGNFLGVGVNLVLVIQADDGYNKLPTLLSALGSDLNIFASTNGTQTSELVELLLNNPSVPSSVTMDSCTCCIIKPHAVKSNHTGKILDHIISQGYEVSAIRSLYFERPQAEEFLEVYQGVIPDFSDMVLQLTGGLCVALEVRAEEAVQTFRQTAGPWDVTMAKELYPQCLRARFGEDRVRSAVHCTDLPQDALLEVEYCFSLMP